MEHQSRKPTNQTFKSSSGEPIKAPPTINNSPIGVKTRERWSLKKLILAIAGSVFVFIVLLIVIINVSTSAPVKVSDELLSNIQSNKPTAAYSLLSTESKNTVSQDDLKAVIEQISPILSGAPKLQSKEINAESSKSNSAKVIYKIDGSDGNTYNFTVNLTSENNDWKVLNFKSEKE